jgi:multiple antibiotic resistance protein
MINYLLPAAVTLFVAIDPISLAPIFLAVTEGFEPRAKRRVAMLATLIAGGILLGASLGGQWLLETMGISMSAFRIAGGLLLFIIATEMLFDRRSMRDAAAVGDGKPDTAAIAAFPLAVPLIAGPASISAVILLAGRAPDTVSLFGLELVVAAIILLCFVVCILSGQIHRVLGHTGQIVVTRLLGLLLAALSVEFVVNGIKAIIAES